MDNYTENSIVPTSVKSSDKEVGPLKKEDKEPERLTRNLIIKIIWCLGLSLFWVIFIWGIWDKGVYALGINAFIFWLFSFGLFFWVLKYTKQYTHKDLFWAAPLLLIIVSYLIYDNPFIKTVNLLIYPALFILFFNYGFLRDKGSRHWNLNFISQFINRVVTILNKISNSVFLYFDLIIPKGKKSGTVIRKVIIGVTLFLIIALTIIIPLLSSADSVFGAKIDIIYSWIKNIISVTLTYKIIFFIVMSVLLLSAVLSWGKSFDFKEKEHSQKLIDSVVSGIVIGGILGLYILFLWIQLERLWVGSLPFAFDETENLVKSGFWQLLFLSIINIAIYFFTYRKTLPAVQKILAAFTFTSLLLLISAGQRMGLYVINYGFSYEKFFASYTVIYCGILFIWLIARLFLKTRANILKFLIFLFLWMFALVTVFPVEQFILRTNMRLTNRAESRIRLFELTMLSPDVLALIKRYQGEGRLKENAGYLEREKEKEGDGKEFDWNPWIEEQEKRVAEKKWYERNIMNVIYLKNLD